ncbi:MAG: hypothetical protein PHR78_03270 [Eubacteriales bacterium]|nr:hypothetical protein [Eubacteriales bacterium]MDD4323500.1 hypothetical protein [Eubacteriales bacterium]MDD4541172.1 hypothetical protein [Eubacteriales bacterium]
MDIKAKIDEIVKKVKSDDKFGAKFKEDPVKAVEEVLGVDLPDEQIKSVVEGVKAKLKLDGGDDEDGLLGKVKGIFGK